MFHTTGRQVTNHLIFHLSNLPYDNYHSGNLMTDCYLPHFLESIIIDLPKVCRVIILRPRDDYVPNVGNQCKINSSELWERNSIWTVFDVMFVPNLYNVDGRHVIPLSLPNSFLSTIRKQGLSMHCVRRITFDAWICYALPVGRR
jgi:hypothetical protein